MHGLLTGFLFPLQSAMFWRELPQPNFFDADAEATSGGADWVGTHVASAIGTEAGSLPCGAFGERVQVSLAELWVGTDGQMGIVLAWVINVLFGCLSFLS
jgi:hypothetical protein